MNVLISRSIVLLLNGNSDVHVRSNLNYLICSRHLFRSRKKREKKREEKDRKEKSQSKLTVLSEEDRVRKEIAGLYSTLVSLVNDRKKQKKSGSSRSGYNSSGSGSGSYSSGRTSSSSAHYHHNRNSSNSKISKKKQASVESSNQQGMWSRRSSHWSSSTLRKISK